jgi:hypothetical protein
LEKAYGDTRNPLAIAEECLLQREKRQAIDQVHDDVERNLSRVSEFNFKPASFCALRNDRRQFFVTIE